MEKKTIGESGLKVIFYIEGGYRGSTPYRVEHPNHELFPMEDLLPTEYNLKKAMESCKKMGYKVTCDPIRPKTVKINRHKEYKQKNDY